MLGVELSLPLSTWLVRELYIQGKLDADVRTGSERARNAKTAGATLAEAGKINESLMYLGQCLQLQSDCHDANKVRILLLSQTSRSQLISPATYRPFSPM